MATDDWEEEEEEEDREEKEKVRIDTEARVSQDDFREETETERIKSLESQAKDEYMRETYPEDALQGENLGSSMNIRFEELECWECGFSDFEEVDISNKDVCYCYCERCGKEHKLCPECYILFNVDSDICPNDH